MSRRKRNKSNYQKIERQTENQQRSASGAAYVDIGGWETIMPAGYISLDKCPEIIAAVNKVASLIATMPIHLIRNTEELGDQRIINELSRKVDINPNEYMTRSTFIEGVVRTLLLEGDGNSVIYPEMERGNIKNLHPIPASSVSFQTDGYGYKVIINGITVNPQDVIHIVINPNPNQLWRGGGVRKTLRDVAETLAQASATKKGFMESKWKPSIIVKVDGLIDEFSNKEGRRKLLEKYVESSSAGEPWLLPADQFDVTTVKPLSLTDLAIKDTIELDKKTVASIIDVPVFILGVGTFDEKQWNNFVSTKIKRICIAIDQAFTKSLLYSPEYYFRMNYRSLLSYDLATLAAVGATLAAQGILLGNEVRESIGYSRKEGLDEFIMLENYIPLTKIGEQLKLGGGESKNGEEQT